MDQGSGSRRLTNSRCRRNKFIPAWNSSLLAGLLLWLGASPSHAQTPAADSLNPGAGNSVYCFALQPDGKILVGGAFNTLAGQARTGIARLLASGTLDTGFNPGTSQSGGLGSPCVYSLTLQPDGKILVGGSFTTIAGQPHTNLARLNADGTLDNGFNPGTTGSYSYVSSVVAQEDGKILVAGDFTGLAGQACIGFGRLNADGTLDRGFNPQANGTVNALAVDSGGKILVAGGFSFLGGRECYSLGRLNADGTLDAAFQANATAGVKALVMQADGKILVGGSFTSLGGQTRRSLGRLNADGTLDATFNPAVTGYVNSLALQADGEIVVGGSFTALGGQTRTNIARLRADGTLDNGFTAGANSQVFALALQADGKILAGGLFTTLAGQARSRLGRLTSTASPTQSLSYDGSNITWLRGGTSPEVCRATLEASTNNLDWWALSSASRIAGGWNAPGIALPPDFILRARGFTSAGYQNGSGSFVEAYAGRPAVVAAPASRTNNFGTSASFTVVAAGTGTLSYQWLKDGQPLANGSAVAGATTTTLILTGVSGATMGSYSVVVSNPNGSVTSPPARLTVIDPLIASHPASQNFALGQTATLIVNATGSSPLGYQWWKDGAALADATRNSLSLTNLQATDPGAYFVVVTNLYGSATSAIARLTVDLTTLEGGFHPQPNAYVYAFGEQPDGKILVGGGFNTIGGQPRSRLARLQVDGTLDNGFNPGADDRVTSLILQPDGKILVGGWFTRLGDQPRGGLGRLNPDGTLDSGFNSGVGGDYSTLRALAIQADGKILVGGGFSLLGGQSRTNLGRLLPDGTVDSGFNPGPDLPVFALTVQPDGKILLGGAFTSVGGQLRAHLARLNADGTVDSGFNPGLDGGSYPYVNSLAVQADGKILVGGSFTNLGAQARANLARLNADGTVDRTFNPGADNKVYSLALQADGKILVGGDFTTLGGLLRSALGRLNPDGTSDTTFNPGAGRADSYSPSVSALALQADGKILAGGWFTTLRGQPSTCLGQLNNTAPATQSLSHDGSGLTWVRGGASPEVSRVTFELSANGSDWQPLGEGARIPGGWQLPGVSVLAGSALRARGRVSGAFGNASDWRVEGYCGGLVVVGQPDPLTNDVGTTATFRVVAGGTGPLGYQWLKDGVPLVEAGNVLGANTPVLTLTNVYGVEAGSYSVRISNSSQSLTSRVAVLSVNDPGIVVAPQSQNREPGQTATFTITVAGTAPFTYQWYKDGQALAGAAGASLTLTNLTAQNAGAYCVVVAGGYGRVTSTASFLTINETTLDRTFSPGPDGHVDALAVQTDGRIVVGGSFLAVRGQPRKCLGRVNADGTLDLGFNPGADSPGGYGPVVRTLLVQPDGKILVGGYYTTLAGQPCSCVGRLNVDGTLDTGFSAGTFQPGTFIFPVPYIFSLVLQADGKILVGGAFSAVAGQTRNCLARLNPDGTLDSGFNPGATHQNGGTTEVYALAVQEDGRILVGGSFSLLGGSPRANLGRLNADGSVDSGFDPGVNGEVDSLAVQADGKILVGGNFTLIGGGARKSIARLNADGTLDSAFDASASGADSAIVSSIALQTDGKILLGGSFMLLGGIPRANLARFNSDGTLDTCFSPAAEGNNYPSVGSLTVGADGALLVGGWFTALNGQPCANLGRLNSTGPAIQNLQYDGSTVTWLRAGSSPEVWQTTFAFSTNGTDWATLGAGTRIPGGWQLRNPTLPAPNGTLRACGYIASSAPAWFVQTDLAMPVIPTTPPEILLRDGNFGFRSNAFGFGLSGSPGQVVITEASTNLVNWIPLVTNRLDLTPCYFSEPCSATVPRRFYRLRLGH